MVTNLTGGDDHALRRSIALLWGAGGAGRRGPKPSRSVDEVVEAAVALADGEGLQGLSMRRVAEALGLSPMSLYTYVPSKAELVDLMLDRVAGECAEAGPEPTGWRGKLERMARQQWAMAQRHPWLLQADLHRAAIGPNILDRVEATLTAFEALDLSDLEIHQLNTLISDYVRGAVRAALNAREAEQRSGISTADWRALNATLLKDFLDPARYPMTTRVTEAWKGSAPAEAAPLMNFEFGLQRVLDGMESFIAGKRDKTADPRS